MEAITTIDKVVRIGRVPVWGMAKKPIYRHVFCKIQYKDGRLSITGVVGPLSSGNAYGGCGQIDGEFKHRNPAHDDARTHNPITTRQIRFAKGWGRKRFYKFLAIWHRWHLNDLKAACEHQRKLGWDKERIDPSLPSTAYQKFDGKQHSWNLKGWVYPPLGYLTAPCPVCGYKYGTAWLHEDVPQAVLSFLNDLPDTDITPAWV